MHPSRSLPAFRCLLAALCLATALPASARLITFDFTSTVRSVNDPAGMLDGSVRPGITFNGSYTFNSQTPGVTFGDETIYEEQIPQCGVLAQVGNYTIRAFDQYAPMRIHVVNDSVLNSRDTYTVLAWGGLPSGSNPRVVVVAPAVLGDSTMSALSSMALPLTPPDLDAFTGRLSRVVFERPGDTRLSSVNARLDSLTLRATPIPEPASLTLLALTALPLAALRPLRRSPAAARRPRALR